MDTGHMTPANVSTVVSVVKRNSETLVMSRPSAVIYYNNRDQSLSISFEERNIIKFNIIKI